MLKKLQQLLFYSILLFLTTQLGLHFWPTWSYVSGLRIDYLSPTVYFTDVLIVLLFFLWVFKNLNIKNLLKIKNLKLKIILFILFLLTGILQSKNPQVGFYGLLKLAEFIFFGWYASRIIKNKKDFTLLVLILSFGVCFESLLSIFQYINQSSINGIFYFFGERTFTSLTPGIANTSIAGKLILRPYGTFPHPNVLAGYLVIAMTLIIFNFQFSIFKKTIFFLSLLVGTFTLFLTMSRIAIILWLVILPFWFLKIIAIKNSFQISNFKFQIVSLVVLVSIGSIAISPLFPRFFNVSMNEESFTRRFELMNTSVAMVKDHPLYGVGLGNFLSSLPYFQKNNFDSLFLSIQPVHNIYLLVLSEVGIVGFVFFGWFIFRTVLRIKYQVLSMKKKNSFSHNTCYIILATISALGFFDHYFLTIQQGQLLFSLVLGLCWSKVNWQNNV